MSAIVGPVPPYSNPPIQPQFYNPSRFVISALVRGLTTLVTTVGDVDYFIGQEVRLLISEENGSWQLNNKTGYVIAIPSATQVQITIDSSKNVDPFIAGVGVNSPQIIPIGDINSGILNSLGSLNIGTAIPGSFINVS